MNFIIHILQALLFLGLFLCWLTDRLEGVDAEACPDGEAVATAPANAGVLRGPEAGIGAVCLCGTSEGLGVMGGQPERGGAQNVLPVIIPPSLRRSSARLFGLCTGASRVGWRGVRCGF